jgi:hypothetical protein
LRNALATATLALRALELGNMTVGGATGMVLKRSLTSLGALISRSMAEVRSGAPNQMQAISVASIIADAEIAARLEADAKGCGFVVPVVDPVLGVNANRERLLAALANLLQNAFKFTQAHTEVTLTAYAFGAHVLIEVGDHCGGLSAGSAEKMFTPFTQRNDDRSGLGLGLSISRQSIEADGGTLTVRDLPGIGCIFTISLPRHTLQ